MQNLLLIRDAHRESNVRRMRLSRAILGQAKKCYSTSCSTVTLWLILLINVGDKGHWNQLTQMNWVWNPATGSPNRSPRLEREMKVRDYKKGETGGCRLTDWLTEGKPQSWREESESRKDIHHVCFSAFSCDSCDSCDSTRIFHLPYPWNGESNCRSRLNALV